MYISKIWVLCFIQKVLKKLGYTLEIVTLMCIYIYIYLFIYIYLYYICKYIYIDSWIYKHKDKQQP